MEESVFHSLIWRLLGALAFGRLQVDSPCDLRNGKKKPGNPVVIASLEMEHKSSVSLITPFSSRPPFKD